MKTKLVSEEGWKIELSSNFWKLKSPDLNKNKPQFVYVSAQPENKEALFSLHTDKINAQLTLEKYVSKWIKDYNYFGFDILASRYITFNNKKMYIVDLVHRTEPKQVRQFVTLENSKVAIMTCADLRSHFQSTLLECQQIVKNFQW